jgi:hypothetical protein
MTDLEDVVRRVLRDRVLVPPAMVDPAGRAVAGARTVRRRRVLLGACAAGLVLVVVTAGLGALRGLVRISPAPPANQPPSQVPAAGVALVVNGHTLVLPDGRVVAVPGGGQADIVAALEVKQGWLVTASTAASDGSDSLLLVTRDATVVPLGQAVSGPPVVSADGTHLAWHAVGQLATGHLTDAGRLEVDTQTPVSDHGRPIALTDRATVLGAADKFDLWVPERGNYVPSWNVITGVVAVYGPLPGGRLVLGLVHPHPQAQNVCLAELDPLDNLHVTRTACDVPLRGGPDGVISPDGHWFVAPETDGDQALIDLTRVFDPPAVTSSLRADRPGVWVDANTLIAPVGAGLRRFDARSTASVPLSLAGVPSGATVDLVPRVTG